MKYNIACGPQRLEGYINVDVHNFPQIDVLLDCTVLDYMNVEELFSHAFLEHLPRHAVVPHLVSALKSLSPSGFLCYTGIPYFKNIALSYINKEKGAIGSLMDNYEVWRLVFGGDYIQYATHSNLFDEDYLSKCLDEAGFKHYLIFIYDHVSCTTDVPLSMGVYASPTPINYGSRNDFENRMTVYLNDNKVNPLKLEVVKTSEPII